VKSTGKATATLTKGSKVLINAVAVVNGDVDKLILDESNDFSGNFTFQIMDNFAFSGNVDFTKYNKEIDDLYDRCYPYPLPNNFDWEKAEENYTKGAAAIFNKYYDVYLVSIKDKTKIAKLISKAVLTTETYEWYGGTYTESYWEEVPMLRFNDSTEVAVSVYFSEGFDKVVKNFEKFIQSF